MGLLDFVIVCGTGLIIKSSLKKKTQFELEEIEELKEHQEEMERRHQVELIRTKSYVNFDEGISKNEFIELANMAFKKIDRIYDIKINGAKVLCSVLSQTGKTEWDFLVDFNNWGHIDGTYWTYTDNYDSSIPRKYGSMLSSMIHSLNVSRNFNIKDFSDEVDHNKYLCKTKLSYHSKRILNKSVLIGYNNYDLVGEHVFSVVSIFRNRGFNDITVLESPELTNESDKNEFEVFNITINDSKEFEDTTYYPKNSKIKIYYYGIKSIKTNKSSNNYKGKNYTNVLKDLEELGFNNINLFKIKDLVLGILKRENAVEKVTIAGEPMEKGKKYKYNEEINIYYHVIKW